MKVSKVSAILDSLATCNRKKLTFEKLIFPWHTTHTLPITYYTTHSLDITYYMHMPTRGVFVCARTTRRTRYAVDTLRVKCTKLTHTSCHIQTGRR